MSTPTSTEAPTTTASANSSEAPWTTASAHLELTCGGYFEGSMGFQADRSQLTQDELTLLAQLKTTTGVSSCPTDLLGCDISITDGEGVVTTYGATAGDYLCSSNSPRLAYDSLKPFLDGVKCKYAKGTADVLEPDGCCLNGMFSSSNGTTTNINISVPAQDATHKITLLHCASANRLPNISMRLLAPDGTTVANGAPVADPGSDEACVQMEFTNLSQGTLVVATTSSFLPAGDFFLKFE